jgi:molybdopterin molybdotransferase
LLYANFETAILGAGMAQNDQCEDYVRARLELNGGRVTAFPFPAQDSSMLMTLAKADALIRRRPFAPPASPGAEIEIIRLVSPEDRF